MGWTGVIHPYKGPLPPLSNWEGGYFFFFFLHFLEAAARFLPFFFFLHFFLAGAAGAAGVAGGVLSPSTATPQDSSLPVFATKLGLWLAPLKSARWIVLPSSLAQ